MLDDCIIPCFKHVINLHIKCADLIGRQWNLFCWRIVLLNLLQLVCVPVIIEEEPSCSNSVLFERIKKII